eukprot:GFUD01118711.1.p1 GENE.GFUD01118711.1~~GFUD01118711.1.p1  ORF type:complete len:403 (+),score=147.85 GFUD01118711.1:56-1264(+)
MFSNEGLVSCDTFVVMGDVTNTGEVVFGKNSDRPKGEVQEVVSVEPQIHEPGTKLKCTYIEIDQVTSTLGVVLSKSAWMWGAEMGANQAGVVIGNEAVWNRLSCSSHDLVSRLLGMDLLRLGLERGNTAKEAVEVITSLLEKYGQGGQCSDIVPDFSYHNSFLIADQTEAWVLETADRLWAAEKVERGCRNISNCLSIGTRVDLCSRGLMETAKENGWWNGVEPFNWAIVLGGGASGELENPDSRWRCGKNLLEENAKLGKFRVEDMMEVLRDEKSGINRPGGDFPTAGSQVSSLGCGTARACHWLTATLAPSRSVFKPFVFCSSNKITGLTQSPAGVRLAPGERKHPLWKMVEAGKEGGEEIRQLESWCLETGYQERRKPFSEIDNVFNEAVEKEFNLRQF